MSPGLPLAYLLTAAAAFVVAAAALPWLGPELAGHYYHPRVLALTHTITLGWITLTIMGASFQLVPHLLERPIASPRLARWQLGVYAVGVIGVVGHFVIAGWTGFVWSAALVALAALAHAIHVGASVVRARPSFTRDAMAFALAGLAATALFGTLLGVNKVWPVLPTATFPTLHAHVQLALLGWVLPTVLAVAARAYPMFMAAAPPSRLGTRVQLAGLLVGAPLVVAGLLLEVAAYLMTGALLAAAAVASHVAWVGRVAWARKRASLDWGLRFVLAGTVFLAVATALGLALTFGAVEGPRPALAYGVLALGGWASLTIIGMMLRIVPFLVWYRVYGPRAGRTAVPPLARLSSTRAEAAAFALLTPGFAALAVAAALGDVTLLRISGAAVALGALAFGAALARAARHLVTGRLTRAASGDDARPLARSA